MPFGIKMLTIWSLIGSTFLPAAFLPGWREERTGRIIPYREWWFSGHGLLALTIGAGFFWSGVGLMRRKRFPITVFLCAIVVISVYLSDISEALGLLVILILLLIYLWRKKSVLAYFNGPEGAGDTSTLEVK
jgi:hypothetical protein